MSISSLKQNDLLWLRDRAIGSTEVSVVIADARDPSCPLVDVNPAFEQMTGYSLAEIKGQNCRFLQGPKSDPAILGAIREAVSQRHDFSAVLLNYRKDGTPFWNELSISPVRDQLGTLTHFVGVQRDVTERERTIRQLKLLAGISAIVDQRADPEQTARAIAEATIPGFADLCTVRLATPEAYPRWIGTYGTDQNLVDLTIALEQDGETHEGNTPRSRAVSFPSPAVRAMSRSTPAMLDEVALDDRHRAQLVDLGLCAVLVVPIIANDIVFGAFQFYRFDPEPPFSPTEIELARDVAGRAGSVFEQAR
ncbi:MAG: PAS domain-containing protein, partial [Chloroflexia bacterium]|nr:PAS domain-containing protein [Chloroflexia bacterium]